MCVLYAIHLNNLAVISAFVSWGIAESDEDHEYVRTNIMYFMASMLDPQFVSIWVDVDANNKKKYPSSQRT